MNFDFVFEITAALNKDPNAISLQSINYPGSYLVADSGRVKLETPTESQLPAASWTARPAGGNGTFTLHNSVAGYLAHTRTPSGPCTGLQSPEGDAVFVPEASGAAEWVWLRPPPPEPATIRISPTNITHTVNPLHRGCHSDSGYTHQPWGFYAQLVVDESFEHQGGNWVNQISSTASATAQLDGSNPWHGTKSMKLTFSSGTGRAGVANRGLGREGFALEGGKPYEGYFFARSEQSLNFTVTLEDYERGVTLASAVLPLAGTGRWTQLSFTLTPSASTNCVGIAPGSDATVDCGNHPSPAHICVRCAGQVVVQLTKAGQQANVDFVYLQPGEWGRFQGLPVQLRTVQWLQQMGVTAIRQGGTFAQGTYYFWKNWTGPAWTRPAVDDWDLASGWGPFEMIDLCVAAGWEPIITTTAKEQPADMGDLVEYCHGDASTTWGARRILDGHPEPYRVRFFEIGNEERPPQWIDIVEAMEQRAQALGIPKTITYLYPDNAGPEGDDARRAMALGIGTNICTDIHVGCCGGVEAAEDLFSSSAETTQGAVIMETNAGTHHMMRAVQEASDLNDFFGTRNARIRARTASFCTERSGHFDGFDQGLVFFLPNMTWGQPPFYVHKLITDTWASRALGFQATGGTVDASVQLADDGKSVVVRLVNQHLEAGQRVTLDVPMRAGAVADVWVLSGDPEADNTPSNPTAVAPVHSTAAAGNLTLVLQPYSYTVAVIPL